MQHTKHFTMHTELFTRHNTHCTLHMAHYTLNTSHGTKHIKHLTLNRKHYTSHTTHCLQACVLNCNILTCIEWYRTEYRNAEGTRPNLIMKELQISHYCTKLHPALLHGKLKFTDITTCGEKTLLKRLKYKDLVG